MPCEEHESTHKKPKLDDESPIQFPHHLISQILLNLPLQSLLRFTCVCKSWKTLIFDPQFAKDHLRISTANPDMTHQRLISPIIGRCQIVSYSVQSLFQNPSTPPKATHFRTSDGYRIIASCNGLLCLYAIHQRYLMLWNPSITFTSKRLPTGLGPDMHITFEGFGHDQANDKYKLLLAVEGFHDHETVTKMYTFGANSCRLIQNFPCHPTMRSGKFVSGTLNWIAKRDLNDNEQVILSFDLGTETCSEMLLPDGDGDKIYNPLLDLDVFRDCLCVCFCDSKKTHWVVWLMKEYGVQHSWTKFMTIPSIRLPIFSWHDLIVPLCLSENGVVLLKTAASSTLVLYNLNDGRLDYLRLWELVLYMHTYQESLVSL